MRRTSQPHCLKSPTTLIADEPKCADHCKEWGLHRSTTDAARSYQLRPAHQVVLGMCLRADQSVYWPVFWSDIEKTRSKCSTCQKIAPSQAKLPPMEPLVLNYRFEHICWDYMSLNGFRFGCLWTGTRAGLAEPHCQGGGGHDGRLWPPPQDQLSCEPTRKCQG